MKIHLPGSAAFNLSQYLGKMTRFGIRAAVKAGTVDTLVADLGTRFPQAEPSWINTTFNWVGSGIAAAKRLIIEKVIGPDLMDVTPVVPMDVFTTNAADRFIISGDVYTADAVGNTIDRRSTVVSGNENSALEELMGKAMYDLMQKIRATNPTEADDFIDAFFEAHWMGRIF